MNREDRSCIACDANIPHPDNGERDCPTDEATGLCAYLISAGARPVWIRVHDDSRKSGEFGPHLLSRGGLLCRDCVERYSVGHVKHPKGKRKVKP